MEIPFFYRNSLKDFQENFEYDFEQYSKIINGGDLDEYMDFLQIKYEDKKADFEFLERHFIEFTYKFSKQKMAGPPSTKQYWYNELGKHFPSKAVAKQLFQMADFLTFNYQEIEHLIDAFYYEKDENLFFNEVEYEREKLEVDKILKYLEQGKMTDIKKNFTPLDFNLKPTEVVYLFDVLVQAGFIEEPEKYIGSYWNTLELLFTGKGNPLKNPRNIRNKYLNASIEGKPARADYIKSALIKALNKMP